MKTTVLLAASFIGLTALAFAAGGNRENSRTTEPGEFYGLIVNANANIVLIQGEKNSVRVEGQDADNSSLGMRIEGSTLIIEGNDPTPVNIYVTAKEINLIEAGQGARLFVQGILRSDILLLKTRGNGTMKLDIRTLSVGMIARDEGKIYVSGSTGESYSQQYADGLVDDSQLDSFSTNPSNHRMHSDSKITGYSLLD